MSDQITTALRGEIGNIMLGTVLLFIGLAACAVAAIRRRGQVGIVLWFGVFTAMYGARILAEAPAAFSLLPHSLAPLRLAVVAGVTHLILIPATLFFMEFAQGALRQAMKIMVVVAAILGIVGIVTTLVTDNPYRLMPLNNVLTIVFVGVLVVVNLVPPLAKRYLVEQNVVITVATVILAVAALYENLKSFIRLPESPWFEQTAFTLFVLALGYVAAESTFADQRRLLAIENELEIAREIQNSILPNEAPEVSKLEVSAVYRPMTAVAGDFYDFIPVDRNKLGVLVADVSGHGVPAALIAAMIKVAMQSVVPCAHDPREVMRGLNRILTAQLRGQFVTAAYLWLDTQNGKALYSAAGHPPLLRWRGEKLERIESNGLLFGVMADSDYPMFEMELDSGDRFLLYTDGVVEPENASGESFGDTRLEQVIRELRSHSPAELSRQLLNELSRWQPAAFTQQDDITLIALDVV